MMKYVVIRHKAIGSSGQFNAKYGIHGKAAAIKT